MEITEHQEGPILVVSVAGRLDQAGAENFQNHTLGRIREGIRSLVIDFSRTSFVASIGIRALIVPAQEITRAGGRFGLTGLNQQLQQLFEVAGLLTVFNTYPSATEALADGEWS